MDIKTDNLTNDKSKIESEKKRKFNFSFIMVDEQRFPSIYENQEIKKWRSKYLNAQNFLKDKGIEFNNHYAASMACAPGRASIYTGHYPSLHGVTQTDAGGDTAYSPEIFWLDPNTVPSFGDYLRTASYDTFWKGKWHVSHTDITIPATHDQYLSYDSKTGVPISENTDIYLEANRLDQFGFNGWVGPEPHRSNPRNSASSAALGLSGRDEVYALEVVDLLENLESRKHKDRKPWPL